MFCVRVLLLKICVKGSFCVKFSVDVIGCDDETVLGGLPRFLGTWVEETAFSDLTAGLALTTSITF